MIEREPTQAGLMLFVCVYYLRERVIVCVYVCVFYYCRTYYKEVRDEKNAGVEVFSRGYWLDDDLTPGYSRRAV